MLKNTNYNRAFFQIPAVFSGKRGRFTPWVFYGFSPRCVHCVCWITGRVFQQHCSGSSVFLENEGVYSPFCGRGFVVGFSGAGGGTLESHCISLLEVHCSVFNL